MCDKSGFGTVECGVALDDAGTQAHDGAFLGWRGGS